VRHHPGIHRSRSLRLGQGGLWRVSARGNVSADPEEDEEPQKEGTVLVDTAGNGSWFSLDVRGVGEGGWNRMGHRSELFNSPSGDWGREEEGRAVTRAEFCWGPEQRGVSSWLQGHGAAPEPRAHTPTTCRV